MLARILTGIVCWLMSLVITLLSLYWVMAGLGASDVLLDHWPWFVAAIALSMADQVLAKGVE
jgi:hypothetical protein